MRIQHQAPALDVSLPPLRAGWRWPPRDMLDTVIGEAVFDSDPSRASALRGFARREWPAASPTITVGTQLHDELTEVTPITPEREVMIERVLEACRAEHSPEAEQAARHVANIARFRELQRLSDKTMREIRDHADRVMAEREAERERVARRVERVAEVVFVSLVAIGFLIWAL